MSARRQDGGRRVDPHAWRHGFALLDRRQARRLRDSRGVQDARHNDNSGVFIRIPVEPREEWMPVHYGYEVQIDNHPEKSNEDDYHVTGTLYSLTKPLAKPVQSRARNGTRWRSLWMGRARLCV